MSLEKWLADAKLPERPLLLLIGDAVLTEPAARRLAAALVGGAEALEVVRRPAGLAPLLADLRTYSLFSTSKVVVALETAVLAERRAAADLIDQAADVLPVEAIGDEPTKSQLTAAGRLVQALRLFGSSIEGGQEPLQLLAQLPSWALQGGQAFRSRRGNRPRGKKQIEELRQGLALLIEIARAAELSGWAEGDLADLEAILREGLPSGHHLILAESSVDTDHPLTVQLDQAGSVLKLGGVEIDRGGTFSGIRQLAEELERETGVAINERAATELGRRTLRRDVSKRDLIDPRSTTRFAAEYRKLSQLASESCIDLSLVEAVVEDRGEEDVWQILDAVALGQPAQALGRLRRLLTGAADATATRLSFMALLSDYCRQLSALRALLKLHRLEGCERNYNRFKTRLAPILQGEQPGGLKSPVAGLHPFRLHRVYLAATRKGAAGEDLAWLALETELRLKGESAEADAALAALLARVAAP